MDTYSEKEISVEGESDNLPFPQEPSYSSEDSIAEKGFFFNLPNPSSLIMTLGST
jgi:hypothetical protein